MLNPPSIGQSIDFLGCGTHGIVKDVRDTLALIVFGDGSAGWHSIKSMSEHVPKKYLNMQTNNLLGEN